MALDLESMRSSFMDPFNEEEVDIFSPSSGYGLEYGSPDDALSPGPSEQQQSISESMAAVNAVIESLKQQEHQLEVFADRVRQLYESPDEQNYEYLLATAQNMLGTVEQEQEVLRQQVEQVHLTPRELHAITLLRTELHVQHTQLEIYIAEIEHVQKPSEGPPLLSLVVLKQPFPLVIRQKKTIDHEELTVKLLTGATVQINDVSPVSCGVFGLEDTSAADKDMVSGAVQAMEPETLTARFPLTFLEGTRKVTANMRFRAQVDLVQMGSQKLSVSVESANTNPFVVMTNQKQWADCEKHLFRMDAYGDADSVTWFRFANTLQRHILLATKQDFATPQRPLSSYDFAYINAQFFGGRDRIYASEFEDFWAWYGKTLQVLRYQRHVCEMWINGYVYGYMSREDVLAALSRQPPGTFVVRFSERYHGQFAVGYVHSDGSVHHYLVKATDTAGAKITLADFLQNVPQFTSIHKFETQASAPIFTRLPKGGVLEQYCSGVSSERTTGSGYDDLIS